MPKKHPPKHCGSRIPAARIHIHLGCGGDRQRLARKGLGRVGVHAPAPAPSVHAACLTLVRQPAASLCPKTHKTEGGSEQNPPLHMSISQPPAHPRG